MFRRAAVSTQRVLGQAERGKFKRTLRQTEQLNSKSSKRIYKGNGGTKEGRHTSLGRYMMDPKKMLNLNVPDLTNCKLKPYISAE